MKLTEIIKKHYKVLSNGNSMGENYPQWYKWFEQEEGHKMTLVTDLLERNVKDEFKAMAVTVMLTPRFGWLPKGMFLWENESWRYSADFLSADDLQLETFSRPLLEYTVEILCACIKYVNNMQSINDQLGGGATKRSILKRYNQVIRKLLSFLDVSDHLAQKLFSHFLLNEPMTWVKGKKGNYSRYTEFSGLLYDEYIPVIWKARADEDMRAIVEGELSGKTIPRKNTDIAIDRYIAHIEKRFLDGNQKAYSSDLALSQLEFIAYVAGNHEGEYFGLWKDFGSVIGFLESYSEKTLRIRQVLVMANVRSPSFIIKNEEAAIFYQYLMDNIPVSDEDRLKITNLIQQEQTARENAFRSKVEAAQAKRLAEGSILASMQ